MIIPARITHWLTALCSFRPSSSSGSSFSFSETPSSSSSSSAGLFSDDESVLDDDEGVPFELATYPHVDWTTLERSHKSRIVKAISAEICACFPAMAAHIPNVDPGTLLRYRFGEDVSAHAEYLGEGPRYFPFACVDDGSEVISALVG